MKNSSVCIQFTGGKDSTLLAAMSAKHFDNVHLLTFRNSLIVDLDKIPVNVQKLKNLYTGNKFTHTIIDNENLLKQLYVGNWYQDFKKYKTYAANNVCSSCRLAMITLTITYCLKNNIHVVRDGANRTGFDLSQQKWSLDIIENFYKEYQIEYDCSVHGGSRNDIDLLKLGLNAENPTIFYRSQPLCKGGGEIHNIYFRCYFLPLYGSEKRKQMDIDWLHDKLRICREYIKKSEVPGHG